MATENYKASGSGQNMATGTSEASEQNMDESKFKIFNDSIHGHIKMHPLLVDIIDTPEFQRLRNIKQMGGIYHVFPGASHNRFEHSIGVCHLAGELVKSLKAQGQKIDNKDILCVQIAGLCHDLGHGPFSHLFEHVTRELSEKLDLGPEKSQNSKDLENWKHEEQSRKMFDLLISKGIKNDMIGKVYGLEFSEDDLMFIHELIEGTKDKCSNSSRKEEKPYLYEIVANKLTGIDVDKMDYISRDCHHLGLKSNFSHKRFMMFARVCRNENEQHICMRDKEAINMYELFHNRYMLHYTVCHHRVNVAIETMITDALVAAEGHYKLGRKTISEAVLDPKTFLKLTDDILMEIMRSTEKDLKTAQEIIRRIQARKLYKFVGSNIFKTNELNHSVGAKEKEEALKKWFENIRTNDSVQNTSAAKQYTEQYTVKLVKLSYGKEEEDPIKYLRFYRKSNLENSVKLDENEVSYMLPKTFSETKVMVFYKGLGEVPQNPPVDKLWEIVKDLWKPSSPSSNEESSENV
ncbi:deoxynucleoside triphosphate triphosphohydrolase SAMHD1-like isoform X2 [Tachysurus fulvidraco]|uniref:deoxynucleoside triphosphate triphosphohydrolase SAMHD1-like isoform X2 n=1 Tax=Tachysurus fulvidraco TaxID=1234273 RepID=UPI001FEDA467|nr:deoxynucleoside triphosphate triphosphohydrolase SAMHD1-like isoform X2 [Tachysurus fulvidraco]